jgi:hypothetical protein
MGTSDTPERWTLSRLPLSARLTLAVFLISVGLGYFSALVQLHFQHAKPGSMLPTGEDAVHKFHGHVGELPQSTVEHLITADESKPLNGSGQMRSAFFRRSEDWKETIKKRAVSKNRRRGAKPTKEELDQAEAELRKEREGEIAAVVAWLRAGAPDSAWKADSFILPKDLDGVPITEEFVQPVDDCRSARIKTILTTRCVHCHGKDGEVHHIPLEDIEHWKPYVKVKTSSAMSPEKLAQTTHVHLLGFSMLYGLTGLILALTSWPGWIRLPLAPLALVAQVVDISFWWLARMDTPVVGPEKLPIGVYFAHAIPISGAVVAGALGLQILLSLFSLFNKWGKVLLVILIAAAIGGGAGIRADLKIKKYLADERAANPSDEDKKKAEEDKKKKDDEAKKKKEEDADKKKDNEPKKNEGEEEAKKKADEEAKKKEADKKKEEDDKKDKPEKDKAEKGKKQDD